MVEPNGTPLDAERERLRKAGYTDAEISQILINRASGGGSPQSAASAPGTMTGVLGNASAVLSHAKGTIPVIQSNIANVADPAASPSSRARSTAVLAFVAVMVAVLGYVVYQEYLIHIVYAPLTAAAQAEKAAADAKIQAIEAKNKHVTGELPMPEIKKDNTGFFAVPDKQAFAHLHPPASDETPEALEEEIVSAHERGDYVAAYNLAVRRANAAEASKKIEGEFSPWLDVATNALLSGHYQASFDASTRAVKYVTGGDTYSRFALACALMMMDRTDEARPLFRRIIAHDVQEDSDLRRVIRNDFAEMRQAGITHPMMAEIEKAL